MTVKNFNVNTSLKVVQNIFPDEQIKYVLKSWNLNNLEVFQLTVTTLKDKILGVKIWRRLLSLHTLTTCFVENIQNSNFTAHILIQNGHALEV